MSDGPPVALGHTSLQEEAQVLYDPRGVLSRRRAPSSSSSASPATPSRLIKAVAVASGSPATSGDSPSPVRGFDWTPPIQRESQRTSSTSRYARLDVVESDEESPCVTHLAKEYTKKLSLVEGAPRGRSNDRRIQLPPLETATPQRSSKSRSRSRQRHIPGHIHRTSSEMGVSPAQEFLSSLSRRAGTPRSLASSTHDALEGVEVDGWILGRTIGWGNFSIVKTCRNAETGEQAAVKIIRQSEDEGSWVSDDSYLSHLGAASSCSALVPTFASAMESLADPTAERYHAFVNQETSVWATLAPHPNVLPLLGVYTSDNITFVFMPLCSNGNLLEYIQDYAAADPYAPSEPRGRKVSRRSSMRSAIPSPRGLPFPVTRRIFHQISLGIAHLHAANVTHRDIKLENILLDASYNFRIADFGLACASCLLEFRDGSEPSSFDESAGSGMVHDLFAAGSLNYCPPEQLSASRPITTPAVDIWALGCVLYALIDGNLPFFDEFEPRLRMKILKGSWPVPRRLATGKDQARAIFAVLQGCLTVDLRARWSIDQVLASDWLQRDWAESDPDLSPASIATSSSRSRSRGRQADSRLPFQRMSGPGSRTSRSRSAGGDIARRHTLR